jgi:RNA recognition motif-containing protein
VKNEKSKTIKKEAKKTVGDVKKYKLTKRFNKLRIKSADLKSKGIVYIGHLPKGFEEEDLKKFFS